jgi:hypothetical protein
MPAIGSSYHALPYRRPEGFRRPSVIFDAQRVVEDARRGRGALGKHLGTLSVRGGMTRQRAVRSDLRINRCTLMSAILAHTDLATGVVVSEAPTDLPTGKRYLQPMSAAKLAEKAYGGLVAGEVSIARTLRGLRDLAELGVIELQQQSERLSNGDILNMPSVKAVTSDFWKLARLWDSVVRARGKQASEKAVKQLQAILAGVARRAGLKRAEKALMKHPAVGAGDPARAAAAAAYRAKAEASGLKGAALESSIAFYMKRTFG